MTDKKEEQTADPSVGRLIVTWLLGLVVFVGFLAMVWGTLIGVNYLTGGVA